jgi:hypothetical protein
VETRIQTDYPLVLSSIRSLHYQSYHLTCLRATVQAFFFIVYHAVSVVTPVLIGTLSMCVIPMRFQTDNTRYTSDPIKCSQNLMRSRE